MHREGHIGLGMLVYAPVAFLLIFADLMLLFALGLVLTVFFSFAPDFDLDAPLVSHRGITHTYLAAVIAGTLSAVALVLVTVAGTVSITVVGQSAILNLVVIGLVGFAVGTLGVLSHLLGDVLTPMGIRPRQPFDDDKTTLDLVYASNERANQALSILGALVLALAIYGGVTLGPGTLPGL